MLTAQEARDIMNPEQNPDLKHILTLLDDKIRTVLARGETFVYHDFTDRQGKILVPYLRSIGYTMVHFVEIEILLPNRMVGGYTPLDPRRRSRRNNMLSAKEARERSEANKYDSIRFIVDRINDEIERAVDKGHTEINYYGSLSFNGENHSNSVMKYLEENGYTVNLYSDYRETYLTISW